LIPQETKIIFFGTPPFAAAILESLIKADITSRLFSLNPIKKSVGKGK